MKTCYKCKQYLPLEKFSKHSKRADGLQVYCKECFKKLNADHYRSGYKARQKQHNKTNRNRLRGIVTEIKLRNPCPCGETDEACLDFHHLGEKDENIALLVNAYGAKNRLLKELRKCCVLCSNCHRKLHAGKELRFNASLLKPLDVEGDGHVL
jgi:hypothetical protein